VRISADVRRTLHDYLAKRVCYADVPSAWSGKTLLPIIEAARADHATLADPSSPTGTAQTLEMMKLLAVRIKNVRQWFMQQLRNITVDYLVVTEDDYRVMQGDYYMLLLFIVFEL
jgi:hypothetical protein